MPPDVVQLSVPGDRPPWTPTGMHVEAGDVITLLGGGFIRWSPRRDVGAGAKFHLWGRVQGGEIFGCTQDTTTVTIDHQGELELCVYKGVWADRTGTLATGEEPYRRNQGALDVVVLRWPHGTDPVDGLQRLVEPHPDPCIDPRIDLDSARGELHRLRHPIVSPPGWDHLLDFGTTDIFRATTFDGRPAIEVVCANDAGIIRKPVALPLDRTTTIRWTWCVDELPSTEAENTTWTHDYISIATEFVSGRDLTWFWSVALPTIEATFACPIRGWSHRETHMPLRSGTDGLGRAHREQRNIWDDHERFMGTPPDAIVAVWLIAVSHFGRGTGRATFTDVSIATGDHRVEVL